MRDPRTPRRRLVLLLGFVVLWAIVIVARLVEVQVYRAEDLQQLAARQQFSSVETEPMRGTILDRNGTELALSRDVQSLYAVPGLVEDPEHTATALASVLGQSRRRLLKRLRMTDRNFIWLARKLDSATSDRIAATKVAGLGFRAEPKRFYPRGQLASHILGYVGLDNTGLAGAEHQFESLMCGVPGMDFTVRDARGVRFLTRPGVWPTEPGSDLSLSIDASIQYIVERELAAGVAAARARAGVAVVLDPNTGEVLAMAGVPTFEPARFGEAKGTVRRNPAVQSAYEPGSTFKIITFAAALEEGRVRASETIDCGRGGINIGGRRIRDHKSFDQLTGAEVITYSSNVGAIVVGSRLPRDDFYKWIRQFGFGRPTGIELPGESPGLLRPARDWSGLSQASISIGQEIGVTPLQLASAFAAVANGGRLIKPTVIRRDPNQPPPAGRRILSHGTASTLMAMMRSVVVDGTAKSAALDEVAIAGKTGTAQKIVDGRYSLEQHVASFVGIAPAEAPRLVVLVAIDEPKTKAYHGGDVAAPVVRGIVVPALARLGWAEGSQVVGLPLIDFYPSDEPADDVGFMDAAVAQR